MELLLLFGPSVVALALLGFAWKLARPRNGAKASPLRLLSSYLLLLPAFAVGSCWGIVGHAGIPESSATRLREACVVSGIVLAGITMIYVVLCARRKPAVLAAEAGANSDRRPIAVLGIVVAFALTVALLGAAWLG